MIHVANPIYDSVFKYLLEDERIAKTLLGALIKREIIDITTRPHEYANTTKENISMFRIDFSARVREADGSEQVVLIELQKNWVETETLRFRQYLGAQYANPANMRPDSKRQYAYPIITIYLLGHRVGDIKVPVLYIDRTFRDYDGNRVTEGIPDPFIESLSHNSIVVQIPLLKGQKNNRLERLLDIFCQDRKDKDNMQILDMEEDMLSDAEVGRIVTRLLGAASDTEIRQRMNIEEEIYTALENRDTEIMQTKKLVAEQAQQLTQQAQELSAKSEEVNAKDKELNAKDKELNAKDKELNAKDKELSRLNSQLSAAVQALSESGMPREMIATTLGITLEFVNSVLRQ